MDETNVPCPSCSPDSPKLHFVLREKPNPRVKCSECGSVHAAVTPEVRQTMLRVIVSRGTTSLRSRITIGENYEFAAGNELIVDDEVTGAVTPVEITSLESGGKRLERALAADIDTVWARAIDEVAVKIAVSSGRTTRSIELTVPGEQEFRVGDSGTSLGIEYRIHSILQRDGASKDREGSAVQAKNIKRIYAKLLSETKPKIRKRSERVAIRSKGMPVWSLRQKKSA